MSFNTTTYESYMHALKKGLESFDSALADEIIHDFESHFADARSQGLSDEEICAELGDVNDVLTFFRQEYATTEQPVARTEAKTSNAEGHLSTSTSTGSASQSSSALPDINAQLSQEPQYSYPSDPAASITRMEIVLRNASASFALPPVFLLTAPENWIQTGLKLASMAILSIYAKRKFLLLYSGNTFSIPARKQKNSSFRCHPRFSRLRCVL